MTGDPALPIVAVPECPSQSVKSLSGRIDATHDSREKAAAVVLIDQDDRFSRSECQPAVEAVKDCFRIMYDE